MTKIYKVPVTESVPVGWSNPEKILLGAIAVLTVRLVRIHMYFQVTTGTPIEIVSGSLTGWDVNYPSTTKPPVEFTPRTLEEFECTVPFTKPDPMHWRTSYAKELGLTYIPGNPDLDDLLDGMALHKWERKVNVYVDMDFDVLTARQYPKN